MFFVFSFFQTVFFSMFFDFPQFKKQHFRHFAIENLNKIKIYIYNKIIENNLFLYFFDIFIKIYVFAIYCCFCDSISHIIIKKYRKTKKFTIISNFLNKFVVI